MRKKNGFTLIELLAVIVILSIVALITTPIIVGLISDVRIDAYKRSLSGIFDAVDLYIASSKFNGFPDEGIPITNENIKMKNKDFTSGKIIKNDAGELELIKISDGTYCGSGTIGNVVIKEGSCDSLDASPPDISIASGTITSNSITIIADANDEESGISGYQFSNDNGSNWTSIQTSNVYNFTNLDSNTEYTFKVKVYNNNLLSKISNQLVVSTSTVPQPTFSLNPTNWTDSATLTITYPDREVGYVYEYSLDEASTWIELASPSVSKDITFTGNASVIARITDGVNEINAASYEVTNIDITAPNVDSIDTSIANIDLESFTIIRNGDAVDNESGLATNPYIYQISPNGSNWTTECTTSAASCNIINLTNDTNYYYRLGVSDNMGNISYTTSKTIRTSVIVNAPLLATGMTPIKWNGTTWVNTTSSDEEWYDYANKKWANAKTVDGSMWVWIPRYAYQIAEGYHTGSTGIINIKFLTNTSNATLDGTSIYTTPTYNGESQTNYIVHPAFIFGSTNVSGIWVAKFEASGTLGAIDIKPNVTAIRNVTINDVFNATRSMETNSRYGWGTSGSGIDTHLMKNVEWGAVSYLSYSNYGKNDRVWVNNSGTYTTGCAGDSVREDIYSGCQNTYDTTNGVKASTTGDIYGVYDMAGGAKEFVAAFVGSGYADDYGSSLYNANNKYADEYDLNYVFDAEEIYDLSESKKGDAVYETSRGSTILYSWGQTISTMPASVTVWFTRGSASEYAAITGLFNFGVSQGTAQQYDGFRPVVVVGSGI